MNRHIRAQCPPIRFLTVDEEEYALIPMRLLEAVEDLKELEDELLAARALQEHDPRAPGIPAEVVHAMARGVHPVRAWREYRGLTQQGLAARTGASRGCISRIERGLQRPAPALARALARALDTPLDVLVDAIAEHGAAGGAS